MGGEAGAEGPRVRYVVRLDEFRERRHPGQVHDAEPGGAEPAPPDRADAGLRLVRGGHPCQGTARCRMRPLCRTWNQCLLGSHVLAPRTA